MNNGPENELGGLGQVPGEGLGGSLAEELGEGLGGDEVALRRMLQGAVEDLKPSDGALDHLRRAVPARRARKRQALVGMAAAALLMGTAVPAFVHVANSSGDDARPVNAGHGEQAQGGTGSETGDLGGESGSDGLSAGSQGNRQDQGGATRTPGEKPSGATDGATGGVVNPPGTVAVTSPVCAADQLGVTSAQAAKPEADGKVYGTFRIANVSKTDCAVSGDGTVGFQALGAADAAKISVVEHTAGDPATGLPDPSQEAAALMLKPDTAYEVRFAWVPTDTCPTTGTSPDPTPSASAGTGTTGDNSQPQLGSEDGGGTADGSVAVTHTAEPGAPNAETTIPNACSGTIYRTGVLNAQ
ncbi:hypothetical protein ACH492_28870 [Streptomyces sp. NPDC019443]|uniref:hypothetical protein n=1 Tax=Streptomyces sp. NPDC019443 TaxID=3365061 RepID=UPI0037BD01C6